MNLNNLNITCNSTYILSDFISLGVFLLFTFLTLALFILVYTKKLKRTRLTTLVLIAIVLGGLANMFERVYFGCVHDYINFFNLFSFNTSDTLITLGLGVFFVQCLYGCKRYKSNSRR